VGAHSGLVLGGVTGTKSVHSRDGTSVFCSLSLRVVKVGRDGDDGVADIVAQVGLSGLLHLKKNHRRDFLGRKLLLHSDARLTSLGENSEGEVLDVQLDLGIKNTTKVWLAQEMEKEVKTYMLWGLIAAWF
jgi:NAD-specific glutamate dehydrogenase